LNNLRYLGLAIGLLLLGLVPAGTAAESLFPIVSNGPVAARYNIVVLAEGYTAAQQTRFLTDATNVVNTLFAREPWQEYEAGFNAFALSVVSAQSGSDHPAYSLSKDTYFNSTYDNADRIITIPSGPSGQGKVDALLSTHLPEWDLAILLVNDLVPGGSDGSARTAIASVSGIADILPHEIGHVAAGLGDEYTTPNPGFPDVEEPNTTRQTTRDKIKWKAWIADTTPLPTPATTDYQDRIGLFEGAHYHETGWYRPKLNCTMQSQYTPEFCEVCREALVLALYERVRPILAATPAETELAVTNADPLYFSVITLEPATHPLSIQWLLNGSPIEGAVAPQFSLNPATLPSGQHAVSALVADPTAFVRNDPAGLLHQTNTWLLNMDLPVKPELTLSQVQYLPNNSFAFSIAGTAPQAAIESSIDLRHWTELGILPLVNGEARYTNANSPNTQPTFFRARAIP